MQDQRRGSRGAYLEIIFTRVHRRAGREAKLLGADLDTIYLRCADRSRRTRCGDMLRLQPRRRAARTDIDNLDGTPGNRRQR